MPVVGDIFCNSGVMASSPLSDVPIATTVKDFLISKAFFFFTMGVPAAILLVGIFVASVVFLEGNLISFH
jgi:hypothetical protein